MTNKMLLLLFILLQSGALALDQNDTTSYFGNNDKHVYLNWVASRGNNYEKYHFLETKTSTTDIPHGAALHWTATSTHLHIAIAARASGWIGFGLSENGGMRGADMVLFANGTLNDAHVLQDLYPIVDDCQNWNLVESVVLDGFIIVEATRELDTGDLQDRKLVNDTDLSTSTTIIMAWGDTDSWSYHGGTNRVRGNIRLFGEGLSEDQIFANALMESEGVVDLRINNYTIPDTETTFVYFCWDRNDLIGLGIPMNESVHVIGIEAIINEATRKYVHHFVALSIFSETLTAPKNDSVPFLCNVERAVELIFGWAPGQPPLTLPNNTGLPFGNGGLKSLQLQVHYNNADLDTGMKDSSGIRLIWTTHKRQYDVGVFVLGDPLMTLRGEPVGNGLASATFDCPSTCSSLFLADEPVTVFLEALHMHIGGVRASNVMKREGVIMHEARVEFYDFEQNGILSPQQEAFQILPGDSFQTHCYYDQNIGGMNQTFGYGSQNEMCLAFLFYYPRKLAFNGVIPLLCGLGLDYIPGCGATYSGNELLSLLALNRSFGLPINIGNCQVENEITTTGTNTNQQISSGGCRVLFSSLTFAVSLLLLCCGQQINYI